MVRLLVQTCEVYPSEVWILIPLKGVLLEVDDGFIKLKKYTFNWEVSWL